MVDIEPYQYQKVTNVKEHNDIVAKINEIVDVLNNSGADTLGPRITKLETDVSTLDSAVKIQYQDIASIKDKDQAQDNNIGTLDAQVKGITESLVSDINVIDGTTTGKFKVRLDREKAPSINSNDYDLQKATSIELIQGSGPSMLKAQITLSDGTILISDDFLFTTEAIGTDVYISSFVFKNGNVAGTISADIGLSNGSTLEANNFVVPMDPSLLNTVQDLSTRLTAVEGGSVAGFKELEAQVNTNKTNIATLTTEIDDLDIKKADQSNTNQEIVAGTITATNITKGGAKVATVNDIPDISGKVDKAQGVENEGKTLVVGSDGLLKLATVESGMVSPFLGTITNLPAVTNTRKGYKSQGALVTEYIQIRENPTELLGITNTIHTRIKEPTGTLSSAYYGSFNFDTDIPSIRDNLINYFRKIKAGNGYYFVMIMAYSKGYKALTNTHDGNQTLAYDVGVVVNGDSITLDGTSITSCYYRDDTSLDFYVGPIIKRKF